VSEDNKRIAAIDAQGLTLASIQELHRRNLELTQKVEELRRMIEMWGMKQVKCRAARQSAAPPGGSVGGAPIKRVPGDPRAPNRAIARAHP